jgi:hypothetical protein
VVELDGSKVKMKRWEALVRQAQTLALNKDASAARLLHQMRKRFPGNAPSGEKYLQVLGALRLGLPEEMSSPRAS